MVRMRSLRIILAFILVGTALSLFTNQTVGEIDNKLKNVETRRKRTKKHQSTSSSSKDRSDSGAEDSLDQSSSVSSSTSSEENKKHGKPKSSLERKGWRKWHRKCTPCPEDMRKKWRDPSINWICGAYQRARRTFKSLCMMYYRNCQDGTMFVKIHDHRCSDDIKSRISNGDHFFYEYKVALSDDSTTTDSEESSDVHSSS